MDEITQAELLEMFDGDIPSSAFAVLKDPKVADKRARLKKMADVWALREKGKRFISIPRYRMDK